MKKILLAALAYTAYRWFNKQPEPEAAPQPRPAPLPAGRTVRAPQAPDKRA